MTDPAYYGRPILKPPVWKREIGWYLFTGGLAGASSTMAFLARASGHPVLARRAGLVATAAVNASPALLVKDLGRPERFLNMVRVFKPSSPMNLGSWLLLGSGATTTAATLLDAAGVAPRARAGLEAVAGVSGVPLSVYTSVLLADTANPAWHEARRELPFLFGSSAAASAGAAAVIGVPTREAAPARRLAIGGALVESAVMLAMKRRLGPLGEPYQQDQAGRSAKVARACSLGGATLLALAGRRSRVASAAGGALVLAGELALRWSVFKAGFQSARDPKYTVLSQRERAATRGAGARSDLPARP